MDTHAKQLRKKSTLAGEAQGSWLRGEVKLGVPMVERASRLALHQALEYPRDSRGDSVTIEEYLNKNIPAGSQDVHTLKGMSISLTVSLVD